MKKNIAFEYVGGEEEEEKDKTARRKDMSKSRSEGKLKKLPQKLPSLGTQSTANLLPEFSFSAPSKKVTEMKKRDKKFKVRDDRAESPLERPRKKKIIADPLPFTESVKHLPDLKTSEDVIAHFARNRDEAEAAGLTDVRTFAPLKFVVLNRVESKTRYLPYDLVVVEPKDVNLHEYYVMTATSVMTFGGQERSISQEEAASAQSSLVGLPSRLSKAVPTDIMDMSRWIHESTCFRIISNLGTFKYYLERKSIRKWRAAIRYSKFCRVQRKVEAQLLFLKPHFFNCMEQASREIHGLLEKPAFSLESRRASNLPSFAQKQMENIEGKILAQIAQTGASIGQAVVRATQLLKKEHRALNEQLVRNKNNINNATKSMAEARMERERTVKAIQSIEHDLKRLPEFCRVLNYFVLGKLLSYVIDSYETIVDFTANPTASHSGVFRVMLELTLGTAGETKALLDAPNESKSITDSTKTQALDTENEEVEDEIADSVSIYHVMDPSEVEMYNTFTEICTKLLETVDAFPLLMIPDRVESVKEMGPYDPDYSRALPENRMSDMTSLTATCADFDSLNGTFQQLYVAIEKSYKEANTFGVTFCDKFREIFYGLSTFSPERYLSKHPGFLTLKKDLVMFSDWGKEIANMKLETKCGTLMVLETRSFKDKLLASLANPMNTCKECLEKLGRSKVEHLIDVFRTACSELEVDQNAPLGTHSAYVERFNRHQADQKFHDRSFEEIQDIYDLMKQFQVKHSIEDAARLEEVAEEKIRFEEALAMAKNHISAQNNQYVDKLKAGIKSMEEFCDQMTLQLSRAPFNDPVQSPVEMMEQLNKMHARWEASFEKAKQYAHMMELLVGGKKRPEDKPTVTYNYEVGAVENCRMILEKRRNVWGCWERWNADFDKWWNTDISVLLNPDKNEDGLTGPQLERIVEEYFQECVAFNRKYKGDEVVEELMKTIRETRSKVSFMVMFGHPSLMPRHYMEMYVSIFKSRFVDAQGVVHKPQATAEADENPAESDPTQEEAGNEGTQDDLAAAREEESNNKGDGGNEDENDEDDEEDEPDPTIPTIADMEGLGLFLDEHTEALEEICGAAAKEYSLLKALDKMEEDWVPLKFSTIEYKDTGTSIFRSMDEIEQTLDDQIVRTQAMRSSRYIKTMEARCVAWEKRLKELEEIISNRLAMQGTWLYLEPIFSSADICKQMPSEAKMFKKVDKLWRDSMEKTLEDQSVMAVFTQEGLLEKLKRANEMLDEIQKGLADYLNAKRVFFPRFFFLSNEELLEILSETKDPKRVQPHLIKCFEGISSLEFSNTMDIKAMISSEGEVVPFPYDDVKEKIINPNEAGGCVEIWLDQIQNIMRKTVAHVFDLAIADYVQRPRTEWLQRWPGQVVLGVSQTYWTQECTAAIKKGGDEIAKYADVLSEYINDIIKMVRGNIPKLVRKTVSPLVVLDVHARDVTAELARLGTSDPNDFDWLSQLRYYWTEGRHSAMTGEPGTVVCRMINAERLYGYEYLGNSMRLVITPLTDRCYRTLMGAVHLDYGGAPSGPAGTGKTETTKDLGKAIAIQCVVYNCSDSLDYKAMGKFFKGLAGTGAWACFDEFNRINLEVLSVVAQQILTIQRAKIARVETFDFEGEIIKLRITCNVFITMNPGYAGRQELPDNLKALFRDVAMMVPDYAMIGQIILYSMGYLEGFKLAKKIVMTYKLCSEQLSNQSHYDYGMRAVMAVLRAAGNLKQQQPEEDENILCLRSIIDVNLPKFLAPDVPLFNGIVSDLFPGVKLPDTDYTVMDAAIREVCLRWRLDPTEYFLTKVHEVYEMMIVRHGFMVVGLPFAGKTTSLKMLQEVLTILHERDPENPKWTRVHTCILNPKSITMGQLYGEFDPVSHEWTDGVLAIGYRNFSGNPPKIGAPEDRKWVWFDGPVDAIWIENMNTVLDDNKKLCLMNGEMMIMSPTMSMIFEPMDLEVASPATVSRVGVIYMEPFRVGWRPLLKSWLMKFGTLAQEKQVDESGEEGTEAKSAVKEKEDGQEEASVKFSFNEEQTKLIVELFNWLVDPAICYIRKCCNCFVPTLDQTLVVGQLRLMEGMFIEAADNGVEIDNSMIENTFLFCMIWSCAAIVDDNSQKLFDSFLRTFIKNWKCIEEEENKAVHTMLMLRNWEFPSFSHMAGSYHGYSFQVPIPEEGLLFDYCYIGGGGNKIGSHQVEKQPKTWMAWTDTFVLPEIQPDAEFSSLVIPTKITSQMERILMLYLENEFPTLVVGPTGTGKSMFVSRILGNMLDQTVYKTVDIAFTAKTSANQTQLIVDSKLDKRRRGIFGPPLGCKCVVFIDDFNMPEVEEYGAQPPIEIVRQLVDNGGWYDIAEKDFHGIVDTQLIAAMCPPGGSRNHITPRMLRHFGILCVSSFDGDTMKSIFNTILSWHVTVQNMEQEVVQLAPRLVDATLEIYTRAISNLLPTPLKSHYTFNLRDFSRIVQGVMLVSHQPGFDASACKRLWVHETVRVMMDRLIDQDDQSWFVGALDQVLRETLDTKNGLPELVAHLVPESHVSEDGALPKEIQLEALRNLFFGNFANPDNPKRPYEEIKDVPGLVPQMQEYLEMYNSESKTPMGLVMFQFAIEHVSRISRVLAMPRGNILLVGVGGSGRQSLTRLAAFVADYSLHQIELSKNYTEAEWREDLQEVLKGAGVGPKPMVFLFADTQVKYESFIEDINCMLNTGEVPNLFPLDVRMEILDRMQKIAKDQGVKDATLPELWRMFIERVRSRLHVALAFSPIGSAFRDRLRKFPSLVNCCTIDWFFAWPVDALVAVARTFLSDIALEDTVRENIVGICQFMHTSVTHLSERMRGELRRVNYVTPTSYLELIRTFKDSLGKCRDDVSQQRRRYEIGLEKLAFAAEQVGTMQQELTDLIPVLEKSKKETNELMAVIEKKLPGVEEMKKTVSEEAAVVQVQADECATMKEECENDLAEAIPLLEDAMKALDTLKASDIGEVKAMKTPPSGVVLVMSAVCQMMGVKADKIKDPNDPTKKIEDYWGPAKKNLLGDPKFLQRLKDYDKDNIPEKVIQILEAKYISNEDFEPAKIKQASVAAFGLCKWVRAMHAYDKVAKVVAPKKAKLAETEAKLADTMETLNGKKAELQKVVDDLDGLQANLEEAKQKKTKLENDVDLCEKKLVRAKQLIDGLGGEKTRWTENVERLKIEYVDLTGNVLVSAGIIAYLGAFTADYRDEVCAKWTHLCKSKMIPSKENPTLFETLGDPVQVRTWNVNGLPTDSFSVDNAIILFNSRRWPLMIDPQGQANKWVRNLEQENNLRVIKLSDPNYMRTLENAVQFGLPVLLENVGEEIDPSLEPVLQKATFKQGGVLCIRLGDSVVEYSDSFRFYITTKLRNPHYLPEVSVKVTLLNFMITPQGLQDQMLAKVVKAEKPDLAAEKERLIVEGADNAAKLKECEDKILYILSSSSGNILEDESAIDTLKSSKTISDEIKEKQAVAVVTEEKIDKVRAGYVPVAFHAQVLYFCIADLANIEPTYQYALDWFGNLFLKSVDESEPSDDLPTRLESLNNHFTYSLYQNVCRSLLEKDKLLFSFLLCIRLLASRNEVDLQEWMFLLTGGVAKDNPIPNPAQDWLSERGWGEIVRLSDVSCFQGLHEHFTANPGEYRKIYDSSEAHAVELPAPWNERLNSFQRMLVLRCLRPDKIGVSVQNFVIEKMGERFVRPPTFNLRECFDDASYMTPLVFVLSAGSDPMTQLIKLSEEVKARIDSISLGQGQGPKAEAMIARAQAAENEKVWVVVQNCHLAVSWMPSLERIVEQTDPATCNRQYRLWCTTYPTPDFPVSILQNSVKMTLEPPRGLRANIYASYKSDPICDPSFFNSVVKNDGKDWRRLLFGLCFFHALVQERRNFGALGWNIPYEFSTSDMIISVKQLAMFLDLYDDAFKALVYCTGEANYGGRVTDDKDRRLLLTILRRFYNSNVLDDSYVIAEGYEMPCDGSYEDYLKFIEQIPLVDRPAVFGLHDNGNITKGQNETQQLFQSVLLTQKASAGPAGDGNEDENEDGQGDETDQQEKTSEEQKTKAAQPKSEEDVIFEVASSVLDKLEHRSFDMALAELKYPVRWDESMNTVLTQECNKFNGLCKVIVDSLKELKKAVRGFVVMSEELEKVGRSLFLGTVPKKWLGASYPSLKPLASYVSDLCARLDFLQNWLDNGMPPVYWLSGFFFTQAFLTGTLQNYARKYSIPIDEVDFDFVMLDRREGEYTSPPDDGAFIYGLFIEGARWDSKQNTMADSLPKILISEAPVIHLLPKKKGDIQPVDFYNCPVYKTSERRGVLSTTGHSTNFVMYIRFPIPSKATNSPQSDPDYWIIAGVACLTSTDD